MEAERATLARRLARVQLVAATGALAIGNPLAALGAAEQALDHDPYDEPLPCMPGSCAVRGGRSRGRIGRRRWPAGKTS